MGVFDRQIGTILSSDIFRQILNNEPISLYKLNILTDILAGNNIPFDLSFSSANRKDAAAMELTLYVNPSLTLVMVVALEPGANPFSASP